MPRSKVQFKRPVGSLFSLTTDCIASNLLFYLECLEYVPSRAKERILKKFITKSPLWDGHIVNKVLAALTHPHLKHITLSSLCINDDTLSILEACRGLAQLRLGSHDITSEGLRKFLAQTQSLLALDVSHCLAFNDEALESLARNCPKLCELAAEGCPITDSGFVILTSNNKNLRCLTISGTQISGDGISFPVKNGYCHSLQEFRLDNCVKVTDNVLKAIAENCPKIEVLTFYNCTVTDETMVFEEIGKSCVGLKQLHWTIKW